MYDAWPWGSAPVRRGLYREQRNGRPPQRGAHVRLGEEHRRQLALERLHRRLQRDGAALPASSAFNWDQGWPAWPEPPFVPHTERQQHPVLAAMRLRPSSRYCTWALNLQRQLPGRFMVEAGYNAQLGRHLTTNL